MMPGKMSVENNLLNLLENENHTLEYRLKAAISTFSAFGLPITKNKETVLIWLKRELFTVSNEEDEKLLYSVLKHCILNTTDIFLRPQLIETIIEILINSNHVYEEVLECYIELLKNVHFVRYFIHNIQKLSNITLNLANILKSRDINSQNKASICSKIVNCLLNVKNNALYNINVKLIVSENLIEPLSIITSLVNDEQIMGSQLFENCIYQMLFSDTSFRMSFSSNILADCALVDGENRIFEIISLIKNYPTRFSSEILASSYSLLLSGFCFGNSNSDMKLKIFVALNSFVNVCPVPFNNIDKHISLNRHNILTANALIEVLLRFDLPLDSTFNSFTLMEWLTALIDIILDNIKGNLNATVFQLLKNAFSCSPHLIENCLKKFTKNVMLIKKPHQALKSYCDLCLYILNVHIKLNRIHKLISALLTSTNQNLVEFTDEDIPDKFDVLPEEIFTRIQKAVTNLPSTVQNVALLNTLLFHFETDCVAQLEKHNSKQVDIRLLLLFDVVTYLITRFISGSRIADHSVPDIVKNKFTLLMENLSVLLGRFGKAVIPKEHIPKLIESYLHICLTWGDMQLLFIVYEIFPKKISKQVGAVAKSPTNLVYLHPYLSDYHWGLIAQRVVNFGNENCINLLNDLVLQKINVLPYLEDEIEGPYIENVHSDGPAVVCAHYLSNQANAKWLFLHVAEFVHLLKPVDVLNLSRTLVKHCQTCDENEISQIFKEDIRETRSVVLAMCCYAFHSLSKKFAKSNVKQLKKIIRKIDYEEMLNAENEDDEEALNNVRTKINKIGSLISIDFTLFDEVSVNSIELDIRVLLRLPAKYLHRENKTVMCLLTLSLVKILIALQFQNREEDTILIDSLILLQGLLNDVNIPESLNIGKMIALFHREFKNTSHGDVIVQRLCELGHKSDTCVDSLIDIVNTSTLSEGLDLATSYLVNFQKIRKRKRASDAIVEGKIKKLCSENFEIAVRSCTSDVKSREEMLILYTFLLRECLESDSVFEKSTLLVHLGDFIRFMKMDFDSYASDTISKFLFVILKYKTDIRDTLPPHFIIHTWCSYWYILVDSVNRSFLKVATMQEYEEMLQTLYTHTEYSIDELDYENSNTLLRVWKTVIDTSVKETKTNCKKQIVIALCKLAQKYVILSNGTNTRCVRMFLGLLISVVQNKQIVVCYQIMDVCFDSISCTVGCNYDDNDAELLIESIELLFSICAVRATQMVDRIPSFYLCYKSIFEKLVEKSKAVNLSNNERIVSAAHKLEKLTDSLLKHRRDFSKTSISVVADLVKVFAEVNIEEDNLKVHLKNVLYRWIDICDSHGLQYLSSTLPLISQNLFKQLWSEYKKYHKFSGKV